MMNFKKIAALALAGAMTFALAACGSNGGASNATTAAAGGSTEGSADGQKYTIGICQLVQHPALDAATAGFKKAVEEGLGAENVTFDEQNASGDSATCSTIVTGFVSNNYDLIMANATPALQAAVSATTEIPILGTSVTDYGAALAIEDLNPANGTGINVSGASDGVDAQLYVDLTLELVPDAKNVSILYCSAEANSVLQSDQFVAAMEATNANVKCTVFTFADSNDIQSVVSAAIEGADALYIPTDNTAASNMTIITNACQPVKMPVICGEENMCANGGLATVSISYDEVGRLAGEQAVEILKNGADVKTLAIQYCADPVKEYNAEYAEAIGFDIPEGFEAITAE